MSFDPVMRAEREALMAEYTFKNGFAGAQVPPYTAVPDFDVLRRAPSQLRAAYPISLAELQGGSGGGAYVQTCAGLGYKFLWAHVDNDDYRSDYKIFLNTHYGLDSSKLPASLHVDHSFNRARAKQLSLPWIRMLLVRDKINTSHGAGVEKSLTTGGLGFVGRERKLNDLILLKLWGIRSPPKGKALPEEVRSHIRHMSSVFNMPEAELEQVIMDLMEVAAFRPKQDGH